MYVMSHKEEAFSNFTLMQQDIARGLDRAGYGWGMWYYNDCELYATKEGHDSACFYWEISTKAPDEVIAGIIKDISIEARDNYCGHSFDCCGCVFLSSLDFYRSTNEWETKVIIKESWGRNV
jgi:hypothetical protein